ncbi:MAG: hypothetical protein ACD_56C00055G0006 [uncultured bacterium]|nr:MAG: hypothetical protein ACD_56C00055G0006 [uncultured bacterium]
MIFIDFDDVIFNTKKFKEDLRKIFFGFGISDECYEKTYYAYDDKRLVKVYDPRAQIRRIADLQTVNEEKILSTLDSFMEHCSSYVFPDVEEFISSMKRENVYLLSYGDIEFQGEKINKSGIKDKISNVFITDKLKSDIVSIILEKQQFESGEKIFFLDDRIEQIADVKRRNPGSITILIKRPEGRYQEMQMEDCCNHQAHNLREATKTINSYEK